MHLFDMIEGDDMCLTFVVQGDPKPTVKWFKDNKEIRKWRAKFSNKGKWSFSFTKSKG